MADGSLSQFKATLARKIERKQKRQVRADRNSSSFKRSNSKPEFNLPKLSESELKKLKEEIRQKAKSKRRNEFILFGIIIVGLICLLLYLN